MPFNTLKDTTNSILMLCSDKTCGKTHHELGYSNVKIGHSNEDAVRDSNTTDIILKNQLTQRLDLIAEASLNIAYNYNY